MFDEYKDLPKQSKYLIYSIILPSLALGMFYTDVSYFLTTVQGVSYELMGIVITVMGVSTFVTSIPLGIAADKYGRRKLLITGNVTASAIVAIFALTTNPAVLLLAAAFEGVSEGAFAASASALIAEKAGDERRTSVFSLFGFAQSMAYGIGSVIIPVIVIFEIFGFSTKESHVLLYVILAILSLASTLIILKIHESKGLRKEASFGIRSLFNMKSRDILVKYVFASAIIAFGAGIIVPLMTAWMKAQYGISDAISGPILGAANIII